MSWLSEAIHGIGHALDRAFSWIGDHWQEIVEAIGVVVGLAEFVVFLAPAAMGGLFADIVDVSNFFSYAVETGISSILQVAGINVGAIESAVSSFFGAAVSELPAVAQDIIAGIEHFSREIGVKLLGVISDISSAVEAVTGSGAGSLLTDIGNITHTIGGLIDSISGGITDVLKPITNIITDVNTVFSKINTEIVSPITNVINTFENNYVALVNSLHTDFQSGIKGILSIPSDISAMISGDEGVLKASLSQMTGNQESIANSIYVPLVQGSIGKPLTDLAEVMKNPAPNLKARATFNPVDHLIEATGYDAITQHVAEFTNSIANPSGWIEDIEKALWNLLQIIPTALELLADTRIVARQQALALSKPTILDVSTTIEAWRRGLLDPVDAVNELEMHGLNESRVQVLHDVAQFLFGPRDAVDLYQRNIIDGGTFTTLMDQNNLDNGQAQALVALMQHILGPGDVIAAQARGIISDDVALSMLRSARVSAQLGQVIQELEIDLVSPSDLIAVSGRQIAASAGFLPGAFKQAAPDDVTAQAAKTQKEKAWADIAWLRHWTVPSTKFWVEALWRGLIDSKTLAAAMTAQNIPVDVQQLVLGVEEELIPVWLVPDVVKSGVWDADKAVPALMKLGYSAETAQILYQYGATAGKTSKSATAGDLSKVSLSNAATMFEAGIIDAGQYQTLLEAHQYSTEAALLTVQFAQQKDALTARQNYADALVSQVMSGSISQADATALLYQNGLTDGEVSVWQSQVDKKISAASKLPSEAQLDKMLTSGIITISDWTKAMELHGYSAVWTERLAKIVT